MVNKDNYVVVTDTYGVRDVNRGEGNEVLSMLVEEPLGHAPHFINGSNENILLYLHEMKEFLEGEHGAVLSQDPYVSVERSPMDSVYVITVGDTSVETMPNQSDDVLEALKECVEKEKLDPITEVYREVLNNQVRRDVIKNVVEVVDTIPDGRIRITPDGVLVDGYYVVDWTASIYVIEDDKNEPDYTRSGNKVEVTDKSKEFVSLTTRKKPKEMSITTPSGKKILLGEREMMFLSKVKWLIERTEYHQDEPFWRWNENRRKEYLN
jgi:hypothetical protein